MTEAGEGMLQVRERRERRGNPFLEVLARPGAWRLRRLRVVPRQAEPAQWADAQ